MNTLTVTITVSAILAIIAVPLSLQVSIRRARAGNVVFGDGGDATLRKRIRAFGNFIEYVPLCLFLLFLAEYVQAPHWLALVAGIFIVTGRLCHAVGMLFFEHPALRGIGMMLTHASLLMTAFWLLLNMT